MAKMELKKKAPTVSYETEDAQKPLTNVAEGQGQYAQRTWRKAGHKPSPKNYRQAVQWTNSKPIALILYDYRLQRRVKGGNLVKLRADN